MEHHLRDSCQALAKLGLPADEAYWLAARRLGTPETLEKEFRKVHKERVWLDRITWGVAFYVIYSIFSQLVGLVANGSSVVSFYLHPGSSYLWVRSAATLIIMTTAAILLYCRAPKGLFERCYGWAISRPFVAAVVLAVLLFGANVANYCVIYFLWMPARNFAGMNTNEMRAEMAKASYFTNLIFPSLLTFLWIPLLAFLLRRSRKVGTAGPMT
jgi:hypothetical protein